MAWLDDHHAEVLTRFRARFDDLEWQLFRRGSCCWQVDHGTTSDAYCCKPRQQRYIFCLEHVRAVSGHYPGAVNAVLVPISVSALGTELPE